MFARPKRLSGLNQTVRGQVPGLSGPRPQMSRHRPRSTTSPHAESPTERGKPTTPPAGESEPRGEPMGLWVEEEGGSEGRPVMGRIEGWSPSPRKRADFPLVFRHERAWPTG